MDESSSSPERPSVKITYLDRQKRRRTITESTDEHPETTPMTESASTPLQPSMNTMNKSTSEDPPRQTPESKGPKKVEVHLPGPEPKRARRDSDESTKTTASTKAKKTLHIRSASSISSLSRVAQQAAAASSPASSRKPVSAIGASTTRSPSLRRAETPDSNTEYDDNASIAESILSVGKTSIRRTEAERLEYYRNQPDVGILEEHRVECTRCHRFFSLGRKQTYAVRPWEIHRQKCDSLPRGQLKMIHSNSTADQRKARLDKDPLISIVKPNEVFCWQCDKWIQLSNKQAYKLYNWEVHVQLCHSETTGPSKRVATAARKLQVVNDSQVRSFGPRNIVCLFCEQNILADEDYDVTYWEKHKAGCTRPMKDPRAGLKGTSPSLKHGGTSPTISAIPFPVRPPPSSVSTSTDSTLVVSHPKKSPNRQSIELSTPIDNSTSESQGIKRNREDEDEFEVPLGDSDSRPNNRPRKETYEPPTKEAPSTTGWFMLPFKAFVRGFRESLKRT